MNILVPVLNLKASGGTRVLCNLASEWVRDGHRVDFLMHESSGEPYFPTEGNIVWYSSDGRVTGAPDTDQPEPGFQQSFHAMRRAIACVQRDYDTVLLNHSMTVWPAVMAGVRHKSFYYIQLYEPEVFFALPSARMKLLAAILWWTYWIIPAKKCFVNSPMYPGYRNIRTRAPIIPPGIDTDKYYQKPFREISSPVVVGIIGRKAAWKGVRQAVDAIRAMLADGMDVRLRVAYGLHMPEEELRGLEEIVETVMPRDDGQLADFYRSVDVMFALATIQQGAPHYPVIESMACGTPVVTTGYYPGDAETTFLVPGDNPGAVLERVRELMRMDGAELKAKLDAARKKVEELQWKRLSSVMLRHMTEVSAHQGV